MPATRLANVGAGDPQPLVLSRCGEHVLEQLAVAGLEFVALPESDAGIGDPVRERVTDALELIEAGDAGLVEIGRHRGVDRQPRKGLGGEAGELVLEPADLAPQLGARQALVASNSKRRERVSIEQIRHGLGSSVNHRAAAENDELVKERKARGVKPRLRRRRSRAPLRPPPGARP